MTRLAILLAALAGLSGPALAECNADHAAASCAEGQTWDATRQACVARTS